MIYHFGVKKAKFKDPRQFKFHKTFGAFPITSVPDTFDFGTVPAIKDQGPTEWCTAFSGSYAIGNTTKVDTSPEDIAEQTISKTGINPASFNGTTPQISDKVVVKPGAVTQDKAPLLFGRDDPAEVANPKNWTSISDNERQKPFGASFEITSDGYQDLFDAVRAALYSKKLPVRLAVWWQNAWTSAPGGIITKEMMVGFQPDVNGHSVQADPAVVLKNGIMYLRVPNSWGTSVGDNGYYYFSREAINQTFYVSIYDPESDVAAVKGEQWNVFIFILNEFVSVLRFIANLFK